LGYPFQVIRDNVIQLGRADFTMGHEHSKYGELSADDKVLLYCFTYMRLHFFESLATFRHYKSALEAMFSSASPKSLSG